MAYAPTAGPGGEVLYQIWQDGGMGQCYWMSEPRLLVFDGANAEAYWEDRGHPEAKNSHPMVVFAIRPELGTIVSEFLESTPENRAGHYVWYRCLHPPEHQEHISKAMLEFPSSDYPPERFVRFGLALDKEIGARVYWVLDEHGNEVKGSRLLIDEYKRNRDSLPDPDAFRLGKLPPIVPSTTETRASSSSPADGP